MVGFDAKQVLISEGRKRALAVMWGVALRGRGVHTAGLVKGCCHVVFQGSHPARKHGHGRGGWVREAVKAEELWCVCSSFSEKSIGQTFCSFRYPPAIFSFLGPRSSVPPGETHAGVGRWGWGPKRVLG